ncbi:MAG TPA: hypothetical protein VHC19_20705 [Pirellulales bacterium]|jgi:hypothetical protein|nr:hypothetical protein [Pirellulales bacterium]
MLQDRQSPQSTSSAPLQGEACLRHDALLEAIHGLEAALASPAPGREEIWRCRASAALTGFQEALAAHVASTESPAGLFGDVESLEPAFHHRIGRLRREHADLTAQAESLATHLAPHAMGEEFNFHDLRQRAGWLLTAFRHHQALEADLAFELYDLDTGAGD